MRILDFLLPPYDLAAFDRSGKREQRSALRAEIKQAFQDPRASPVESETRYADWDNTPAAHARALGTEHPREERGEVCFVDRLHNGDRIELDGVEHRLFSNPVVSNDGVAREALVESGGLIILPQYVRRLGP